MIKHNFITQQSAVTTEALSNLTKAIELENKTESILDSFKDNDIDIMTLSEDDINKLCARYAD